MKWLVVIRIAHYLLDKEIEGAMLLLFSCRCYSRVRGRTVRVEST